MKTFIIIIIIIIIITIIITIIIIIIVNEKPRGSLIEQCTIVSGAEKISNRCYIE